MITIKQLAKRFEDGLNTVLGNSEIQFKIWANAGEYKAPVRDGNTVTHYIIGNLKTSTSANEANALVMGVNGLTFEFSVPIKQPRTNAEQTEKELAKIKDEQYPFIAYILNAVNQYFQRADVFELKDDEGIEFTVAYQAGTVIPGDVDLAAQLGNHLVVSVYIEVYFIEEGLSSKNVFVYFDNEPIPFTAVRHGRTPVVDSDVYAGKLVSKSIVTSSAFAIDLDLPANLKGFSTECLEYLLSGEPNTAHFVNAVFGDTSKLFLMTLNTVQTSAQGIAIAGESASLIEVIENAEALNLPDGYQLGRFSIENTQVPSVAFTVSEDCNAFMAGVTGKMSGAQVVPITPADITYDESTDGYFVYLITDVGVGITKSSAPFTVIKESTPTATEASNE